MKLLPSLLVVFSIAFSASVPAAEIDTAAVLRCGNMVQHVNGIQQSAADVAMEALAPPQTKADKWFITVVTIKGCGPCTKLKEDWQKNANLSALANPEDPERSWANFNYYDYQDASQAWRFENLDIRSFPTILVQPPRSGKYGDPTTVVFQSPYKGKPTELANDITGAIKQYVIKLQQTPVRETQHGQAPWDGVRIPLPAFDQPPLQIPPADSTSSGFSVSTLVLSMLGAGFVPFLAVAGLNAWRAQRKSAGKQLILNDAQFEALLKILNQQSQPKN